MFKCERVASVEAKERSNLYALTTSMLASTHINVCIHNVQLTTEGGGAICVWCTNLNC